MLDRKTKDIDASIELLEDRVKRDKSNAWIIVFMGAGILLIGILLISTVHTSIIFIILGVFYLVLALHNALINRFRYLLIYLKKCNDKEEKHE